MESLTRLDGSGDLVDSGSLDEIVPHDRRPKRGEEKRYSIETIYEVLDARTAVYEPVKSSGA